VYDAPSFNWIDTRMDYTLHLQDPTASPATYLFEEIVAAARKATHGRAIFAFVSRDGVDALFEDPELVALLRRGTFEIVVGIDAVTTRPALERLVQFSRSYRSLRASVFWNESQHLFHPKLCYFAGDRGGTLIVGSGNLTSGGLQSHFEAFGLVKMTRSEAARAIRPSDDWLAAHASHLRSIDDEVLAQAERNALRYRPDVEPDASENTPPQPVRNDGAHVLIAEIPRSGDRWAQVNFDIDTIRRYFRVRPGSAQRVFLERRLAGNELGGREVRPCVDSGRSQNYRIEIAAARGLAYPADGRPVVVFLKTAPRVFRYQLVLPGDDGYEPLIGLLGRAEPSPHRVRRTTTTAAELEDAWPDNALLR
jgi:HKD family nuclease